MRTYSRKQPIDSGQAAPPPSPPKRKKPSWANFLKRDKKASPSSEERTAEPSAVSRPHHGRVALDEGGEDEDEERAAEQSYLDFEQNGLPAEECPYCGMRYSRGVKSDESVHRRHCKRFRHGEKWPPSLGRLVRNFPDGTCIYELANVDAEKPDSAAKRVLEIVDMELGFADSDAPGEGLKEQTLFVLLTAEMRVIGALVAVPTERAFRVDASEDEDIVRCSSEPEEARVGVSRIWVHRDHRRKQYAVRLLDTAFEHADRNRVAFSQPTQMGRRLAEAWFGRKDFLLFRE